MKTKTKSPKAPKKAAASQHGNGAKPRIGRPPLEETRERVALRLLPDEVEAFKRKAAESGLGYSTWMRMVCRREAGLGT